MKKLCLIKNPCLFQGEDYLNSNKNYFEGWYFKNTNGVDSIAFIPGISINNKERKAFIQVITNDRSYYVDYDIKEFSYNNRPFYVKIGNNYFYLDSIHIDINDNKNNLVIYGDISIYNSKNIRTSVLSPNIMGIFSYVPFMECNHAIISMKGIIDGSMSINDKVIKFNKGISYIEKDWGVSFPSSYLWCQGNCFNNINVSFMLSIANIPFGVFSFRGLICVLIIGNKEYRFSTYNGAKVVSYKIVDDKVLVMLKKGTLYLELEALINDKADFELKAPVKGNMSKNIRESICSVIKVTLKDKDKVIFSDKSSNCGLEVVN